VVTLGGLCAAAAIIVSIWIRWMGFYKGSAVWISEFNTSFISEAGSLCPCSIKPSDKAVKVLARAAYSKGGFLPA
jgi:hypothetical protein